MLQAIKPYTKEEQSSRISITKSQGLSEACQLNGNKQQVTTQEKQNKTCNKTTHYMNIFIDVWFQDFWKSQKKNSCV